MVLGAANGHRDIGEWVGVDDLDVLMIPDDGWDVTLRELATLGFVKAMCLVISGFACGIAIGGTPTKTGCFRLKSVPSASDGHDTGPGLEYRYHTGWHAADSQHAPVGRMI